MKKRKIIVLLGFILLSVFAYLYFKNIFLPIKFKGLVGKHAQEFFHRPTSIGEIHFSLIEGFILKDIQVLSNDVPHKPFLLIKKATFKILFAPLIKKKQVIIPSLKIEKPFVHLIRQDTATWNFSDLINAKKEKGQNGFSLLLGALDISNGTLHFTDRTREQEFSESISDITLRTAFSLEKIIKLSFMARVPQMNSLLKAEGFYDLTTRKFSSQMTLENIDLGRYFPLLNTETAILLKTGVIASAAFNLTYQNQDLQLLGGGDIMDMNLVLGDGQEITGNLKITDSSLTWQNGKLDLNGSFTLPAIHLNLASHKNFQGDIDGHLNSMTIFNNTVTALGEILVNNAVLTLDDDKILKGHISAHQVSFSRTPQDIRLQADYTINAADFKMGPGFSLQGNISTTGTGFVSTAEGLAIQTGIKIENAALTLGSGKNLSGQITSEDTRLTYKNQNLLLTSQALINNAEINIEPGIVFKGSPDITFSGQFILQEHPEIQYEGSINLQDALLRGIPTLDAVDELNGKILFKTNSLQTDALTFKTQNADVHLTGNLTNFTDPAVDITISSENIDLEKTSALFPALLDKIKMRIKGAAGVKATYKGPVKSPDLTNLNITAQLREAGVSSEKMPQGVSKINGQIDFTHDLLTWTNLQGTYDGRSYLFNGALSNFSRPTLRTDISSENLTLSSDLRILHSAFRIVSLQGKYFQNAFDLKGDVHFTEGAEPHIDLRGTLTLDLESLATMAPPLKERLASLKPTGRLSIEGLYRGQPKDWRNWELTLKILSPGISLMGYPLNDLNIQFTQRDQNISKCDILSKIYGGGLSLTSSVDLTKKDLLANAVFQITNLDLAQLRKNKKLKNDRLAGNLSLLTNIHGPLLNLNALTGDGTLSITEGYLYEWNLLKGIFSLLLIPELNDIVFTEALADFSIREGRIHTRNAELSSTIVKLRTEGWIDFSRNINLNISPQFSEIGILQSESLKKGPTALLTHIINIQCAGSIDKPQCSVDKSLPRILGNTTGIITDGIKGVLDEIF